MTNREKVDNLLGSIRELEQLVSELRDSEIIPASFFRQSFELTQLISQKAYGIEQKRLEDLEIQFKEQRSCIEEIRARVKEEEQKVRELTIANKEKEKELTVQIPPLPEPTPTPPIKEEVVIVPEEKPKVSIIKPEEKHSLSLKEILEKKNLTDFRKSFSLNDRFFFKKELFGGSDEKMTKAINDLNELHSLKDSLDYIKVELGWDFENKIVADFIARLEKRFI
ncbi:hypothetical protein [Massilibacteroides sp.]|uniref:hypothetical protein n=1 Tax=Massilibacteroides sp. TaxID=2034766 RepID=UPI0026342449|nr:hypothetical protein [Massilibacteroides sp.]MDD4516272.1 hypothetical protein [Massilibacteroides sp.]